MSGPQIHPRPDNHGKPVTIKHPSTATPLDCFDDPTKVAIVVPDGEAPESLNGTGIAPWKGAPTRTAEWLHVNGQAQLSEPAMTPKAGKKMSAGVVTIDPDGRFWAVAPTNSFGNYKVTFPKGTIDNDMTPQASAIKEAFEESGLQVEITDFLGDFERSTSVTRYYMAKRVGGDPATMGWESQAVLLIPKNDLLAVLDHPNDKKLVEAVLAKLGGK